MIYLVGYKWVTSIINKIDDYYEILSKYFVSELENISYGPFKNLNVIIIFLKSSVQRELDRLSEIVNKITSSQELALYFAIFHYRTFIEKIVSLFDTSIKVPMPQVWLHLSTKSGDYQPIHLNQVCI